MHPDSPKPPTEKVGDDRASSGAPSWTTWQRLDEELPQWDSWATLAATPPPSQDSDAPEKGLENDARPSRTSPGITTFRLGDAPYSDDAAEAARTEWERPPSDGTTPSSNSEKAEPYNHRPLFSPDDNLPASTPKPQVEDGSNHSGDGFRHSGDGHRPSGDGFRHSRDGHRPSGDGFRHSGDGHRPSGDGFRHSGDGHGPSGDGTTRGNTTAPVRRDRHEGPAAAGDENGRAAIQRDEYEVGPENDQRRAGGTARSDYQELPLIEGDGFETGPPVGGDGFEAPAVRGDGFETGPPVRGDGFEAPAVRGDGFGTPPVRGDGFDTTQDRGDGFEAPAVRGDGFDSDGISGDGFDALDARGDGYTPAEEAEEILEPWNDLSEFTHVHTPHKKTEDAEVDRDDESDEGFSALDLRDRVVIMLLFKQVVQIDAVEKAHKRWQKQSGGKSKEPLWRVLTLDPAFDREKIFAEAAQVYAFKQAHFEKKAAAAFIKKYKDTFADSFWDRMNKLRVLPIRQETNTQKKEKRIIFISHDPSRPDVNRLMRELKLDSFELQYCPEAEIEALIHEAFPKRNEYLDRVSDDEFAFDLGTSYDQSTSLIDEDALEAEISRSSLINLFEASLVEAVRRGVSDIHIFPNPRKQIEIHFRIDGELECWHREERVHPEAFLAVVKDNTLNVDRFERDSAQDGFIQRKVDDTLIRYRVSVLPVANANQEIRSESIVIRVLDDRKVVTDLGKLGLLERARAKFEWAIRQPHGMVILTGPTGSGKTTTLFAALHQVVTPKVNVLTVEDPVEYVIPGVRQIKLSHKLELEQALRSILRHDPDIVMVGEMRDRETAELAIKLANTGHLTFSTLHTNDAPSAVSRLYKMGVEPFLIAYAINLVVAQRLLRTLCTKCKRPQKNLDVEMLMRLGFTREELSQARFYDEGHNPDCRACGGTGYRGRRAITETMAFSPEIRRRIVLSNDMIDEDGLREQAVADGMLTLRGSAREIVKQGDTSVTELIRVTAGEH